MSLHAHHITAGHHPGDPVLTDVTLTIPAGTTIGLTGPSGSGKTTLARVLAGLHTPHRGHVTLDDQPLSTAERGAVAMLFQSPRQAVTGRWTLGRIIAEPLRDGRGRAGTIGVTAARVGLTDDLLDRRPHQVSDGQLQRACLARALVQQPRYLICDEMTAMLDPATTAALTTVITEETRRGLGVLTISHHHTLLDAWADHTIQHDAAAP
ncbi:ATP-binding cassette domain-containing protein [Rhodococcus opacus]|uniref:ATP-binding cassette domain-containing protein n=1 Tax=Rhodococcus opacus TaxID=37919 RepID=A0AAX3YSB8_RHOOP|nr:ATP-binding cassette domain-containing protein [Rhodococcus opacus]MCZ4590442.1 ATP-binding cassette domain-containing protein [Rhodococcus opacus]WLF51271.1 ATP-binding cassette domain-containing protein [Rhodococcus opacus]